MYRFRTPILFSSAFLFAFFILSVELTYLFRLWSGSSLEIPWLSFCYSQIRDQVWLHLGMKLLILLAVIYTFWQWMVRSWQQWSATRRMIRRLYPIPANMLPPRVRQAGIGSVFGLEDSLPAAFTLGLIRPKIVVTSGLLKVLNEEELEAVLHHEAFHQKHRDPLKMWIVQTLARSMQYLPVIGELVRSYRLLRELMADQFVIQKMGSSHALGSAILKMVKKRQEMTWMKMGMTVAHFTSSLDVRILRLLDSGYRVRFIWVGRKALLFSGLFLVIIGMASCTLS
ncbi:MAG: hypothetical protein BAA01_07640 [Bacillus thermozeamaize]|uniref:Peptidase M56 domain-containing protein n=1 Tax=Bacillus thermozeamaize TaxID=230954 RepID=A0A1Y3PUW9_9BACI|nr:MAG: hypothetical protein BAA01_07640 [Bacillus thermozeamaize]